MSLSLFGGLAPADASPAPPPPWIKAGAACWARFGNQGWSPGVILSVRPASRTCLIELVSRRFKRWTKHGQPRGTRPFDRMAPRDPAAKGGDRPPKPDSPQAAGWGAGPS